MLVSAAISRGHSHQILESWLRGRFELVVSPHLLYELEAVLMRPWFRRRLSYEEILEYVMWLHDGGTVVDQLPLDTIPSFTADPDDDYLVHLAALFGELSGQKARYSFRRKRLGEVKPLG